jgi:hypothetical protein
MSTSSAAHFVGWPAGAEDWPEKASRWWRGIDGTDLIRRSITLLPAHPHRRITAIEVVVLLGS